MNEIAIRLETKNIYRVKEINNDNYIHTRRI